MFRARGVTNVERTKLKIKTKIETNNNNLTNCIFLTPDVYKIINSLSLICFIMNILRDKIKDRAMNFGIIPNKFNKE